MEAGPFEAGISEICAQKNGPLKIGFHHVGSTEIRRLKVGSSKVRPIQICPFQIRPFKVGLLEILSGQIAAAQIGLRALFSAGFQPLSMILEYNCQLVLVDFNTAHHTDFAFQFFRFSVLEKVYKIRR
jgi:hypothetical protein